MVGVGLSLKHNGFLIKCPFLMNLLFFACNSSSVIKHLECLPSESEAREKMLRCCAYLHMLLLLSRQKRVTGKCERSMTINTSHCSRFCLTLHIIFFPFHCVFAVAQTDGCTFALRKKIFKTFTAESFYLGRYDWYHFFLRPPT